MCWGHSPYPIPYMLAASPVAIKSITSLQPEDVKFFKKVGKVQSLSKGALILTDGKASDALYIVVDGELDVVKDKKSIAGVTTGAILGEVGFLTDQKAAATVRARTAVRVLSVPSKKLRQRLKSDPDFASRWNHVMGEFAAARVRERLGAHNYPVPSKAVVAKFTKVMKDLSGLKLPTE